VSSLYDHSKQLGNKKGRADKMGPDDTVLLMIHKRIRKRESYDVDSVEITEALAQNGYPMEEDEVLQSMGHLKTDGCIRAYEDSTDFDPTTGQRIQTRVTRYWGIEITPEGAMRAIDVQNQFRYGN
jgi:hypothetical protein